MLADRLLGESGIGIMRQQLYHKCDLCVQVLLNSLSFAGLREGRRKCGKVAHSYLDKTRVQRISPFCMALYCDEVVIFSTLLISASQYDYAGLETSERWARQFRGVAYGVACFIPIVHTLRVLRLSLMCEFLIRTHPCHVETNDLNAFTQE